MIKEPLKTEDTVVSPEGLEEVVKSKIGVSVMLTQGGKYRLYIEIDDARDPSPKCFDTLDEAKKVAEKMLLFTTCLLVDPKRTMDNMLGKRE